jgi:hypothetical protein
MGVRCRVASSSSSTVDNSEVEAVRTGGASRAGMPVRSDGLAFWGILSSAGQSYLQTTPPPLTTTYTQLLLL